MYILLDLAILLLLFVGVFRGIKKGFFNTSYGLIGSLLVIVFGAAFAGVLTVLVLKLGLIADLQYGFINLIGETNGLFESLKITSEQVAYWLAIGIVFIVCFIISYVIMLYLNKGFLRLMEEARENVVFRVIDSFVGLVVNVALVGGLVLGVFGLVHGFNAHNLLTSFDEVIRACPLSGLIYEVNPLNSVFENLGFIETIAGLF